MTATVVVVGGGVAGLTAAHRLVEEGCDVTLVEADDRLGGKLRTSPFAGRLVDEGADAFLLRVPWALDVCRRLGIADELVNPAERRAYVYSRGALRPFPPSLLGVPTDLDALAASGVMSAQGVARAGATPDGRRPPLDGGDRTIASVIEEQLGVEVLDRLVDPLVGGINAGDTRRLSLAAVVPQLDAAARDATHGSLLESCRAQQQRARDAGQAPDDPVFASPASGMGRLVDALAAALPPGCIRLGRRVESCTPDGGGTGGYALTLDGGGVSRADAVVIAVPAHAAARLLATVAPGTAAVFGAIEHASVALVTLALRPADIGRGLDGSGFLVPRVEGTAVTACSWSSAKWAHLAPDHGDGTVVLRASVGRHGDDAALDADDDDLAARVLDDLARTMGLCGAPTELRVNRWPASFPQYEPGHLDRIATAEAALPAGVAVAGAALRGVGVPACIRSGTVAAERILVGLG